MNCSKIMDMFYEYESDSMPFLNQILIAVHAFFCPSCAEEIERYNTAAYLMKEDFSPELPRLYENNSLSCLEDSIMSKVTEEELPQIQHSAHGVPSTRGWVIAGLILMVSLITAFFGLDFRSLANASGMSFMLPMGITIGIILTIYGALFIGSHLKELSERFGL